MKVNQNFDNILDFFVLAKIINFMIAFYNIEQYKKLIPGNRQPTDKFIGQ